MLHSLQTLPLRQSFDPDKENKRPLELQRNSSCRDNQSESLVWPQAFIFNKEVVNK